MSALPLAALVGTTLVLLSGCGATSSGNERASRPGPEVRSSLANLIEKAGIPGLQVAVLEAGQLAWSAELGVRNASTGAPVEADTVFQAASLSKPVLAYITLKMVERGELDLDQSLHELLAYERFTDLERARQLTPRYVLSHQTGLPNWGGDPLEFDAIPGSRFGYSGEGYVYLQRVLESQTELDLDELARREVFEPLGMKDSRFTWAEGEEPALATGHDAAGDTRGTGRPDANAASSLHTTARDYARFLAALFASDGLEPTTLHASFEPAVRMLGNERNAMNADVSRGTVGWGLGWGLQGHQDQRVVWHWGDNGVFRAFAAFRPADGAGIVYFANSANGLAIAQQLIEPIVGDMSPTIHWLNYEQSTAPTWAPRRQALLAESAGSYANAIEHHRQLLALRPDDPGTARRIEWLEDLLRAEESPVVLSPERLEHDAGRYGPRILFLENGTLHYQREGRPSFPLIALGERTFALDGLVDFRLEIVVDDDGNPTKLIGHYISGDRDESPRDD